MPASSRGRLFFTIDVEDWTADFPDMQGAPSRVAAPMHRLLDLLEAHQSRATLFFLVECARRHPEVLQRAVAAGHHIGLHGLDHRLVYRQQPDAFERAIREGRQCLEDVGGVPVTTYRAPCWSITRESLWAVERLEAAGFEVDSSIFPTKNHLYGIPDAPVDPYALTPGLVEIPPSVALFGNLKVPFGGGFYLRALPLWVTQQLLQRNVKAGRNVVLYVHPWELDVEQPRDLPYTSVVARTIHYFQLRRTEERLAALLRQFGPFEALPQRAEAARALLTERSVPLAGFPAPRADAGRQASHV
ncbi:polysaccharide deacetylase family protein [Melittangium boletus]|nr:polysaccharide deacetylase family protein [Melittangium boletus]